VPFHPIDSNFTGSTAGWNCRDIKVFIGRLAFD